MRVRTAVQAMFASVPRARRAMQHVFVAQAAALAVLLIAVLALLLLLMSLPDRLRAQSTTASPKASPTSSRAWSIDARPMLRIGHQGSGAEFSVALGATRLPDGGILVGDRGGEHGFLRFSSTGALQSRLVRKGSGPGEMQMMLYMLRCGDSIVAGDFDQRVLVFNARGEHVRMFRLDRTRQPYRSACNASGRMLHQGWEDFKKSKQGVFRANVPVWMSGLNDAPGSLLGMLPGSERFNEPGGGAPLPLGREPRLALGRDRAYYATGDSMFVDVFALTGERLPPLRQSGARARASAADRADALERDVAVMGEKSRRNMEALHARAPKAEFLPATREIVVDADDNVWVQHFPRGGARTVSWTVFSRSGVAVSTVQLPTPLEVFEIGRDYVLGRYTDSEAAVPEVHMYKLKR